MNRIPIAEGEWLNDKLNGNILVVGATGSGKSTSVSEPRILHSFEESLVIPVVKQTLVNKYEGILKSRGYKVVKIDLSNPKNSTTGFNPLEGVSSDSDILSFATEIAGGESRSFTGESDPYWGEATVSTLAAEAGLAVRNAFSEERCPEFSDLLKIHSLANMNFREAHASSSLDAYFDICEEMYPNCNAPKLWKTFSGNSSRTSSCIYSMVNNALDKLLGEDVLSLFTDNKINLGSIGEEKTALFVISSPAKANSKKLSNLLYSSIFRCLFKKADEYGGKLPVKVHILTDDFACGSKIPSFASYISVFREIGVSCTLLLQSLSQLSSIYGLHEGRIIEDNCDTRLYFGGSDLFTVEDFSKRLDVPLSQVLSMKVGDVVVAERGRKAKVCSRYRTYEDEEYCKL